MDLLGAFQEEELQQFAARAKELEDYIVSVLKENQVKLKIYDNLDAFLHR